MTERATVHSDMPYAEYARTPGLSATVLKAGRLSMLRMRNVVKGKHKDDTPAKRWGRIVHAAILEPERVLASIAVWDGKSKKSKAWDEFKKEHAAQEIITVDERDELTDTIVAVRKNKTATRLLTDSIHEQSIFWTDRLLGACKARLDGISQSCGIVEVKTTGKIHPRLFGIQFFDLGYDIQAGWYHHAAKLCELYGPMPVHMIVVDVSPDHDVYVEILPEHIVAAGYDHAVEIGIRYRACQAAGVYPGVAGGEDVLPLEVPRWIQGQEVDVVPTETIEGSAL